MEPFTEGEDGQGIGNGDQQRKVQEWTNSATVIEYKSHTQNYTRSDIPMVEEVQISMWKNTEIEN